MGALMATREAGDNGLKRLLRRRRVVELGDLRDVLGTVSRMTVFRRLREVGYQTSYTHRGQYYTLADIPDFDEWGLWFHRDVGFSQAGTLKETATVQVEEAPDGRTHAELRHLLRVRVHNTLLGLVREGRVGREPYKGEFLYVSADSARAAAQVLRRQEADRVLAKVSRVLTPEEIVEVLVEALRAAPEIPAPLIVARHLAARGMQLEPRHVQQIFDEHGLVPGKKTALPS